MRIVIKDQPQLYYRSEWEEFLDIPPFSDDALERAREQIRDRSYPREALVDILTGYNKAIGNDAMAMEHISSLRSVDAACVFTGQQMGFMGGPMYTILKAISCIQLARESGAIPVFWAATEDHDIAEIDHTYLIDPLGNLKRFRLNFPHDGSFVEDLLLTESHLETIREFCFEAGVEEQLWDSSIKVGEAYGKTMVRLLARLFAGTGLVFIEPYLLRPLAVPFLCKEIQSTVLIQKTLQTTTESLQAKGGKSQLVYEEGGTNLFLKDERKIRRKIRYEDSFFYMGNQKCSQDELLKLCMDEPSRFSVNASARVVLQNLLFPVLAYVAGPSEINYYHQLRDYHHIHGIKLPWIVSRLSATLITKDLAHYMELCHLCPWDDIPQRWDVLWPDIKKLVLKIEEVWNQTTKPLIGAQFSHADLKRHISQSVQQLKKKIIESRLHREKISSHALHVMHNMLHPHHKNQERTLNWFGFQAKTPENLIKAFLTQTSWKTPGHHYCWI